jgi:hypothetical protein
MMSAVRTLLATLLVSACSTVPIAMSATAPKSFDPARDLIVIGKLTNQDYQGAEIADDLLGHGWITADLRIKQVLRGKSQDRILKIKYFAHTYLREDRSVKVHLRRAGDGSYLVCKPPGGTGLNCS